MSVISLLIRRLQSLLYWNTRCRWFGSYIQTEPANGACSCFKEKVSRFAIHTCMFAFIESYVLEKNKPSVLRWWRVHRKVIHLFVRFQGHTNIVVSLLDWNSIHVLTVTDSTACLLFSVTSGRPSVQPQQGTVSGVTVTVIFIDCQQDSVCSTIGLKGKDNFHRFCLVEWLACNN